MAVLSYSSILLAESKEPVEDCKYFAYRNCSALEVFQEDFKKREIDNFLVSALTTVSSLQILSMAPALEIAYPLRFDITHYGNITGQAGDIRHNLPDRARSPIGKVRAALKLAKTLVTSREQFENLAVGAYLKGYIGHSLIDLRIIPRCNDQLDPGSKCQKENLGIWLEGQIIPYGRINLLRLGGVNVNTKISPAGGQKRHNIEWNHRTNGMVLRLKSDFNGASKKVTGIVGSVMLLRRLREPNVGVSFSGNTPGRKLYSGRFILKF